MVLVNWTFFAINDLHEIKEYIAKDSKRYAEIVVRKIYKSPNILQPTPQIGRVVPEINRVEIREIIYTNYRIIYKIVSMNRIDILTIHHTSRLMMNNKGVSQFLE